MRFALDREPTVIGAGELPDTMTEVIASITATVVSSPTYSKSEARPETQMIGSVSTSIRAIATLGAPRRFRAPAAIGSSRRQLIAATTRPPVMIPTLRVEMTR